MSKEDVKEIKDAIETMAESVAELVATLRKPAGRSAEPAAVAAEGGCNGTPADLESIYQAVKARLMKEAPALVRILADRPELRIEHERRIITLDTKTAEGQFGKLVAEGFFDNGASGQAAYDELRRRGVSVAKPSVYDWARKFAASGILTIERGENKAGAFKLVPGTKKNIVQK